MKKDIKEILGNITPETPIEELIAYCDTVEDLEIILKSIPNPKGDNSESLSPQLKQRAKILAEIAKKSNEKITTAYIQKNLEITYPHAAMLYDFLKQEGDI